MLDTDRRVKVTAGLMAISSVIDRIIDSKAGDFCPTEIGFMRTTMWAQAIVFLADEGYALPERSVIAAREYIAEQETIVKVIRSNLFD